MAKGAITARVQYKTIRTTRRTSGMRLIVRDYRHAQRIPRPEAPRRGDRRGHHDGMSHIVKLTDDAETAPKKRGPYKKKSA